MPPDDKKLSAGKDETQLGSARSQEAALKCPRCDSTNTKFCYYNNYNLTQPRHFCKTCRRYWTKGGALRNVPIGGGCRKNKRLKASQRMPGDSNLGSCDVGGLKVLFQNVSPAMDFQLGGLINFPSLHHQIQSTGVFSPYENLSSAPRDSSLIISTNPFLNLDPSAAADFPHPGFTAPQGFQEMGSLSLHSSLASSIESLSCINQDLHWKLQQQRFSMYLAGGDHGQKENTSTVLATSANGTEPPALIVQKPQPILFQNLDLSWKQESYGIVEGTRKPSGNDQNLSTEWFFDNTSYAAVAETPTPTTGGSASSYENAINNWCGMPTWSSTARHLPQ